MGLAQRHQVGEVRSCRRVPRTRRDGSGTVRTPTSQSGMPHVRYMARNARRWDRFANRVERPRSRSSPSDPIRAGMMTASQHRRRTVSTGSPAPSDVSQTLASWSPSSSVARSTTTVTSATRSTVPVTAADDDVVDDGVALHMRERHVVVLLGGRAVSTTAPSTFHNFASVKRVDGDQRLVQPGLSADPPVDVALLTHVFVVGDAVVGGEVAGQTVAVPGELLRRHRRRVPGQLLTVFGERSRAGVVERVRRPRQRVDMPGRDRRRRPTRRPSAGTCSVVARGP